MPDFSAVKNAPDISFIDNVTIEDVRDEMVADYEEYMTKSTGQTVTLPRSCTRRPCKSIKRSSILTGRANKAC